jgi:hypothetical protein
MDKTKTKNKTKYHDSKVPNSMSSVVINPVNIVELH